MALPYTVEKIGDLNTLQTTEKTNLVGAINEINTELNSPEYSSLLVQDTDIFTTGTSKDGTDVSSSVVDGALSDIKLKGMTRTNIAKDITENVLTVGYNAIDTGEYIKIGDGSSNTYRSLGSYRVNPSTIFTAQIIGKLEDTDNTTGTGLRLEYLDINKVSIGFGNTKRTSEVNKDTLLTLTEQMPSNCEYVNILLYATACYSYFKKNTLMLEETNEVKPFISGTKSTVSVALDSVGKNLFDGELELGYYDINNGSKISSTSRIRNKNLIKVGIDNYFISGLPATDKYLLVFDESKNLLTSTYLSASITTRSVTISQKGYIAFYSVSTDMNLNIQLEKGNIATEWEKYKHSQALYTLPVGEENRRLPNGIYDEIDGSGKRTKRTKKHALLTSNITSLITSGVNTDYIQIDNLPSIKGGTTGVDGQTIINGYKEIDYNSIDTTNGANSHYLGTNGGVRIIVPKGTYATLTDAQNDLIAKGTSVIYQLAKEETTQLEGVTLPVGFKGGTITIRPQDDSAEFVAPEFEYKVTLNKSAQIDGNTRMSRQNAEEIIRIYARLDVAGI